MPSSHHDSEGPPQDDPNDAIVTIVVGDDDQPEGGGPGQSDLEADEGFVSLHRRTLNRIAVDSVESRRHEVPSESAGLRSRTLSRTVLSKLLTGGPSSVASSEPPADDNDTQNHSKQINKHKKLLTNLEGILPCLRWMQTYDRHKFVSDLIAGLTVGVMIVPQSMSYAKLAGLPVEFGLYSALVPVYAYAIFGSSRQLAVGPVALISLLVSSGLPAILERQNVPIEQYQEFYNGAAIQVCFLAGMVNIFMGVLRLGFVTIFLSHAVISGFTTGAAIIIGASQVKLILGYDIERSDRLHEVIAALIRNIDGFNWRTFLMGCLSILSLVTLKNIGKTYPKLKFARAMGPLVVVTISIILVVALNLDNRGIPVVDNIPKGLPTFDVSSWFPIQFSSELCVLVIAIVIVGFMESIAIGKSIASKHKYEIDSSQELIGLGMANLLGAMFQSFPVTGSFSRSAVNNESGAVSGVAGMVTATLVMIVLILLTFVFEKLPQCVLAAIVISGVLGLIDSDEAIHLFKVHKFDFSVWVTACLGTVFLGVEIGLAIAVGVSLLIVLYESAYPHTSVLGRLPGTRHYRNVKQYPEVERYHGIVIIRIDAPLFFANAQNVRDKIRKYRLASSEDTRFFIIDLAPVSHIDTSALHILTDMYETYLERKQQLLFANPSLRVMRFLTHAGFCTLVGREHFFTCLQDAVEHCLKAMDSEAVSVHAMESCETASDE